MTYLLDTCVVSKILKNDTITCSNLAKHNIKTLSISILTKLEINYGLGLKPTELQRHRQRWQALLEEIRVIDFRVSEEAIAHVIRIDLHKKGKNIGDYDLLIAATALANGLVCVTNNTKEFNRVNGLSLEDWTI